LLVGRATFGIRLPATSGRGLEDVAAALAVFGDYSLATAMTPPIPTVLYKQRHDHIEKAWRAGDQSLKAP